MTRHKGRFNWEQAVKDDDVKSLEGLDLSPQNFKHILIDAIRMGSLDIVNYLLNSGAEIGENLINEAYVNQQSDIIDLLLSRDGKIIDERLLGRAVDEDRWDMVRSFLPYVKLELLEPDILQGIQKKFGKSLNKIRKARMKSGATYVSLNNLENILKQLRRQQINPFDDILTGDTHTFKDKLVQGKYLVNDIFDENILLFAAAQGKDDIVKFLLESYEDPHGKRILARNITPEVLDAAVLSGNTNLVEYLLNKYEDIEGDTIYLEQLDLKTLLTGALSGIDMLTTLLEWRDARGRGFTVSDIADSQLLEKLVLKGDKESLKYLLNDFRDYTNKNLNVHSLLANNLAPIRTLIGGDESGDDIYDMFLRFSDDEGRKLSQHHFAQAIAAHQQTPDIHTSPPHLPISFDELIGHVNVEQIPEKREVLEQGVTDIINKRSHELAEAIAQVVSDRMTNILGQRFSANFDGSGAPFAQKIPIMSSTPVSTPCTNACSNAYPNSYANAYANAYVNAYPNTRTNTYANACTNTYANACTNTYVNTYPNSYVNACSNTYFASSSNGKYDF